MLCAALATLGSKLPCGGAAAGSQRFRASSQPLDDGSQHKPDVGVRCSNGHF